MQRSKVRLFRKLPLTWWTGTVPALIMQAIFSNGTALHIIVNTCQSNASPMHRRAWTGHVDSWTEATSVELESVSVVGSSRKIYLQVRSGRAVTAHAADASASAMDGRDLVLRLVSPPLGPAPSSGYRDDAPEQTKNVLVGYDEVTLRLVGGVEWHAIKAGGSVASVRREA